MLAIKKIIKNFVNLYDKVDIKNDGIELTLNFFQKRKDIFTFYFIYLFIFTYIIIVCVKLRCRYLAGNREKKVLHFTIMSDTQLI